MTILSALYHVNGSICDYDFAMCMNDTNCAPIADYYINVACNEIINGNVTSGNCTDQCKYGFTSYLSYVYQNIDSTTVSDYCDCGNNTACSEVSMVLEDMGCIDETILNDCHSVFAYGCQGIYNETCGPIGDYYLGECEMIINGSLTSGDCPYDCLVGLTAYVDTMWPNVNSTSTSDYCTCPDPECSAVSGI